MAARLPRWIPALFMLATGGVLGWLIAPAFTSDLELDSHTARNDQSDLSSADVIRGAWLPLPELEQHLQSFSADDERALLARLEPAFWCSHPNGRDALRIVVRRLAEQHPPAELTQELFREIRSWEMPAGARVEAMRNLTAALVLFSEVTPKMIGEALHGATHEEIRAAAAAFAEERRGESIEQDSATLHQLLLAAGTESDRAVSLAGQLAAAAWFYEQPEAAISFAIKQGRQFNPANFRPMLRQLYALDAPAAVAALKLMAVNKSSSYGTGETAFLAGLSPAEFRDVWSQVPEDERLNCLRGFSKELALQAPGHVLELAGEFSADELFTQELNEDRGFYGGLLGLLPLLAERDPDRCRAWLDSLSTENRLKALESAAGSSSRGNAAFARFCLADPDFRLSSSSAHPVLNAIAEKDLAAALRELPRVPADKRLEVEAVLHGKAILERFSGDIAGVLQALQQLPEELRNQVRTGISPSLAFHHKAQLEQWIASNSNSPEASELQIYLADQDAFLSNAQREAFLARSLPTMNAHPGVASFAESHLRFLAETNPASAAEWFAKIPDGDRKTSIAQTLAQKWAITDSAAAVVWAEQLPPSRSRDGALFELAAKQSFEPAEALQRIAEIADSEWRFTAAQFLVREWALTDHERAMEIAREISLSEVQQRKLQEIVESSPTRIRSSNVAPR